ncbi:MAG: phosphatidylglycerol lysyltransferase domain-containing protein [Tannerellaceae bacterium]|jgi:hypothetical protein|nr:phosphatidylglycerol lysyltransferase domain-containing protein [Tannerellaceae bacterium]
MNLSFKAIEPTDKAIITSYTFNSPIQSCDISFANMCSWHFLYKSEYTEVDGFLLIRFRIEIDGSYVYVFPIGNGDIRSVISLLEEDSLRYGRPLSILGVTQVSKAILEETYPDGFTFESDPSYCDYIYLREDLVNLTGKKYQPKRNHINRFRKQYNYRYLDISSELVPECLRLESQWYKANSAGDYQRALQYERRSMTFALNHADEIGLAGGAICVEEQIVAFAFGAPINANTFGVHVEKADVSFDGAYSVINQEFAAHIPQNFIYINREEDLGIPGLRQAKRSYHPTILLEKYRATRALR